MIGKSSKGISRLLMRFPGIDFSALEGVTVTYAAVSLRDLMCEEAEMPITCYPFTGSAWTESTADWSVTTQSWGDALSTHIISYDSGEAQPSAFRYFFEITSLAQQWVNGSADEDLGIILRSTDAVEDSETLLYKTFASYERASYKPTFTITYRSKISLNKSVADVDEGSTLSLSATTVPAGQAVTWSSSDTSVATVSETGRITGVKAGVATITATCEDAEEPATCTVYVTIADGVYYIQNVNSEHYMHVPYGDLSNSIQIRQYLLYSPVKFAEHELIRQMWKIQYLGEGVYSIRPLFNLRMGLAADANGNVFVHEIGTRDNVIDVTGDEQWYISSSTTGYRIKNRLYSADRNKNDLSLMVVNSSTSISAALTLGIIFGSGSDKWNLVPVDDVPSGIYLLNVDTGHVIDDFSVVYLALEETWVPESINAVIVSYSEYSVSQTVYWSSRNESVADVNTSGKITGISEGTTEIMITNSTTGEYISITAVVLPVANGTYLIKNKENNCFVEMADVSMGDDYFALYQGVYGEIDVKSWRITHLGDGYFSICSLITDLHYLCVSDDSTALNASIETKKIDGEFPAGAKWKIETTSSGALKFTPQTGVSNGYVLATTTYDEVHKAPLIQGAYVHNNSYKDEWLIAPADAFLSRRVASSTITLQVSDDPLTMSDEWYPLIVAAVNSWNNANAGITINLSTEECPFVIQVVPQTSQEMGLSAQGVTYAGLMYPNEFSGNYRQILESATIFIFAPTLAEASAQSRKHTIAHEIGHLLGLADNPNVFPNKSIMHYKCNRELYYIPQQYDIENVRFIMNLD